MPPLPEQLAAVAHLCWCTNMQEQGWRFGPEFDPVHKTHDALIDFLRLAAKDRDLTVKAVQSSGIERQLAALVCYPRGPDRPFETQELCEGLEVGLALDLDPEGLQRGRVIGWETDPEGQPREIRVRWTDGSESAHHPLERELRRLAPS